VPKLSMVGILISIGHKSC